MRVVVACALAFFGGCAPWQPGDGRNGSEPAPAASSEPYDLPCAYAAKPDAPERSADQTDVDWDRYEHCARIDREGRMRVDPTHLERIVLEDGFASVLVEPGGWYYLRPDGASLGVITFDNGPDPWSEGLARGKREGRIVFFDRRFEQAIEKRFDWAWPFENGHALVCDGCVLEPSNREHRALVGGNWWFIDHAGDDVPREQLSGRELSRLDR